MTCARRGNSIRGQREPRRRAPTPIAVAPLQARVSARAAVLVRRGQVDAGPGACRRIASSGPRAAADSWAAIDSLGTTGRPSARASPSSAAASRSVASCCDHAPGAAVSLGGVSVFARESPAAAGREKAANPSNLRLMPTHARTRLARRRFNGSVDQASNSEGKSGGSNPSTANSSDSNRDPTLSKNPSPG